MALVATAPTRMPGTVCASSFWTGNPRAATQALKTATAHGKLA
jgi:hypothetical protein